ncbi:AraC family transcriptional regulator [Enterococcus sp. LJL99]
MHMYEVDKVLLNTDFVLEYKKRTDHKMDRPHFHDGYEVHFTLSNGTNYFVDERKYIGNTGSVAVFNPQEIHRVVVEEGMMYERYFVLFKPQYIEFVISEYPDLMRFFNERCNNFENVIQLKAVHQKQLINLFNEIIRLKDQKEVNLRELKIKQRLVGILLVLSDYYNTGDRFERAVSYHKQNEIKEIILFLKQNYYRNLTLEEICERFFISKSTLIRLFKVNLGMTPNVYLSYIRIIEAKKLLKQGYPIKSVAIRVGFGDDSTFIKKFKKVQGASPKQYVLQEKRRSISD